jgi:hypothetical protein
VLSVVLCYCVADVADVADVDVADVVDVVDVGDAVGVVSVVGFMDVLSEFYFLNNNIFFKAPEIPGIGEMMLASFPLNKFVSPNTWYILLLFLY